MFDIIRTIVGKGSITGNGRLAIFETRDNSIIGRVSWFDGDELAEEIYSGDDALGFFKTEFPGAFYRYMKKNAV